MQRSKKIWVTLIIVELSPLQICKIRNSVTRERKGVEILGLFVRRSPPKLPGGISSNFVSLFSLMPSCATFRKNWDNSNYRRVIALDMFKNWKFCNSRTERCRDFRFVLLYSLDNSLHFMSIHIFRYRAPFLSYLPLNVCTHNCENQCCNCYILWISTVIS